MPMRYYLISESNEGTFYLVNGWSKYKAFWTKEFGVKRNTFKSQRSAKASYTRLCKTMPEYLMDTIKIGGFRWEV